MSEPEILSMEEVRVLATARQGNGAWVQALCDTVEHWHREAGTLRDQVEELTEELDELAGANIRAAGELGRQGPGGRGRLT